MRSVRIISEHHQFVRRMSLHTDCGYPLYFNKFLDLYTSNFLRGMIMPCLPLRDIEKSQVLSELRHFFLATTITVCPTINGTSPHILPAIRAKTLIPRSKIVKKRDVVRWPSFRGHNSANSAIRN